MSISSSRVAFSTRQRSPARARAATSSASSGSLSASIFSRSDGIPDAVPLLRSSLLPEPVLGRCYADPVRIPAVSSDRLDLVPMSAGFLRCSLARDASGAEERLGAAIPDEWPDAAESVLFARLIQLEVEPELQPWLLRAIVLRDERRMVGHIGFHTAPDPDYLRPLAPGAIELGYTIFPGERRRGYAREACTAMIDWAHRRHRVQRFVVSIAPSNGASLALARTLGFRRVGSHVDEQDGAEDVFALDLEPPPAARPLR
jgi:RimJ/RimL family protein N-acetyltransferase